MARFGGNEFTDFSVPLVFAGRYFILEPATSRPLITVFLERDGKPVFEVLKNEPQDNPVTVVSKTPPGIVTVSDRKTGRFLYKVRPGSETSVTFGRLENDARSVRITDRMLQVDGMRLTNNRFKGQMAGVYVGEDGSVGIGAPIPPEVLRWF